MRTSGSDPPAPRTSDRDAGPVPPGSTAGDAAAPAAAGDATSGTAAPAAAPARQTRVDQARERGRRAGDRAAELRERRALLDLRSSSTRADLAAAQEALADGVRRAGLALERAGEAHEHAALAHDRTAEYLEELAGHGGPAAEVRRARALRHRAGARADRAAGVEDTRTAAAQSPAPAVQQAPAVQKAPAVQQAPAAEPD